MLRLGEEPEQSLQYLNDAIEAMAGRAHAAMWVNALLEFAETYEALGELGAAEQRAIEALLLSRQLEHQTGESMATVVISALALTRGRDSRPEEIRAHISRMEEACEALTEQPYQIHWQALATHRLGQVLQAHGEEARAAGWFARAEELWEVLGAELFFEE